LFHTILQDQKGAISSHRRPQADIVNKIIQGDALEVLRTLESESIDTCITSPPYYGLRNYGVDGQFGLEPTYQEYISKLVAVFDEVKRVLKKEGSLWIVLADCYDDKKSLLCVPERFVAKMVDNDFILRNHIIWEKPNVIPSSVKSRFTVNFENVYWFVKADQYYFEPQYEPMVSDYSTSKKCVKFGGNKYPGTNVNRTYSGKLWHASSKGRIKRSVWRIATQPYLGAHQAVFPEKLVLLMVKATCPVGGIVLDCFCGIGTSGLVALKNARRFIGVEINPSYIDEANNLIRLKH
jgi:DNA modification methylase